jgi:hypothetical protein
MRRILPVLVLLVALAPLTARHAQAYESWCFDDPIISVNGRLVDVQVQMPVTSLLAMRSTALTVVIPRNVSGAVVVDDVSAFPMKTMIAATGPTWNGTGDLPITVVANVTAATDYSIRLQATPLLNLSMPLAGSTTAYGTANTALQMPMSLGR